MTLDLLQRDAQSVWHPYTAIPVQGPQDVIVRGEGAYLYTQSGRKLFDATSSWWSQIHGHCHPRLAETVAKQAQTLDQILFAPHTHEIAVELAERLVAAYGAPMQRLFFSDDGSTAVEAGLKMAAQYWQNKGQGERRLFVSIEEGYHGDTLGAISVGFVKEFHHFFDKVIQSSIKSTFPYCYRCPLDKSFPSCELACLHSIERVLEEKGTQIAALIVEPLIMGAAGMIRYPNEYLEKLISLCRQYDILVIFDEVFTGFGRTGKLFAADYLKNKPDIACLSKGLTSGMLPLGATLATEEIFQAFCGGESKKFYHGHTFTANALGCAVALESLKMFSDTRLVEKNQALEGVLRELGAQFAAHPHVGDVRQLGMILAMELVEDKSTKQLPTPHNGRGWAMAKDLWEKGVWMRPIGNVVYLVPPYCTTPEDLRKVGELMYGSLCSEFK